MQLLLPRNSGNLYGVVTSLGIDERLVVNVEGKWLAVGMNEVGMWMAQSTVTTSTQSKLKSCD